MKPTWNEAREDATHWMDDLGRIVSDKWLRTSPRATSDYRAAYNIPGTMKRGKFVPLNPTPPKDTKP